MHKVRFVSIGSVTGDEIQLSAENLRSADLYLSGSGLSSWTKDEMQKLFSEIISVIFQLEVDGKIKVETVEVNLKTLKNCGIWKCQWKTISG